jgi:hypothetical protein
MFYQQMVEIQKVIPNLKLVGAEGVDLSTFEVEGQTFSGVTWDDLVDWEVNYGAPDGLDWQKRDLLREAVADKVALTWLTFEAPMSVKIGSEEPRDVTIVINAYYGAETNDAPHRRAMSTSDVMVYNGHSYIGNGPLDPMRYDQSDFPGSYQILFFNSCVSFNYYEKDFFGMKEGGTDNLDMITNGLESWVSGSGQSVGRFVGALLNGKQLSYKDLLIETARGAPGTDQGIDALRVVDGEIGNKYKKTTKITVTPQ